MNATLQMVLSILKMLGIDPAKFTQKWTRDELDERMTRAVPWVVDELEADGTIPAEAGDEKAKRQMIRSAMYFLLKKSSPSKFGSDKIADAVRDHHDDAVVEAVKGQINAQTSTEDAVEMIKNELLERIF